jgi:hypothetical protein
MNVSSKQKIIRGVSIFVVAVILFSAGFCTGRYRRLGVLQSDSNGTEQSVDTVTNGLISQGSSINSGINILNGGLDFGHLAFNGSQLLQSSDEQSRIFRDEIKREVENSIRIRESYKETYGTISDSTERALEIAIAESELLEQTLSNLQRIIDSNTESDRVQ